MNINRRQTIKTIGASTIALAGAPAVSARGHKCQLNWRKELSDRKPSGRPVVNVTQEVVNDIDSGFNGYWAYDDYRRLIQMWEVEEEFRAVVQYNGQFDAVEGQNEPGQDATGTLDGDEDGTMHGGYVATITGSMLEDPEWPLRGFVGTYDYEGDVKAGERPEVFSWHTKYFDESTFAFDWWGWVYYGGDGDTWVNAQSGSCGNIS